MTRDEKIQWMAVWAAKNNLQLVLDGTVGFGRPCVGVLSNDNYPEYNWFDPQTYDRIDQNGDVWTPPNAYHKHPCVAVLGTGEEAESQLYDWLKWFDQNNFKLQVEYVQLPHDPRDREIHLLMGKDRNVRLVKEQPK